MLPAHIAQNIRKQIRYYLQSTLSFRDKQTARKRGRRDYLDFMIEEFDLKSSRQSLDINFVF